MNKLLKALLFLMLAVIPMQGFCFPEIPEDHWMGNTLNGFWEEPQYTTGYNALQVMDGPTISGISGPTAYYSIMISGLTNPYNDHVSCSITSHEVGTGGRTEWACKDDIERYPDVNNVREAHPYEYHWHEHEIMFCNFPENGRLIVEIRWRSTGRPFQKRKRKIMSASCCWQTLEMMEASLN